MKPKAGLCVQKLGASCASMLCTDGINWKQSGMVVFFPTSPHQNSTVWFYSTAKPYTKQAPNVNGRCPQPKSNMKVMGLMLFNGQASQWMVLVCAGVLTSLWCLFVAQWYGVSPRSFPFSPNDLCMAGGSEPMPLLLKWGFRHIPKQLSFKSILVLFVSV